MLDSPFGITASGLHSLKRDIATGKRNNKPSNGVWNYRHLVGDWMQCCCGSFVLSATVGSNLENFRPRAWTASERIGIVFGRWLETVTVEKIPS